MVEVRVAPATMGGQAVLSNESGNTQNLSFDDFWSRAVLARVHCSRPSGTKRKNQETENGVTGVLQLVKNIYPPLADGTSPWSKIIAAESAARRYVSNYGVVTFGSILGAVVVPNVLLDELLEGFENYRTKFNQAVEQFLSLYPQIQERAQEVLGEYYDPNDYAPLSADSFKLELEVFRLSLPTAISSLDREEADRLVRVAHDRLQETAQRVREHFLNVYQNLLRSIQRKSQLPENKAEGLARYFGRLTRFINLGRAYADVVNDPTLRDIIDQLESVTEGDQLPSPEEIVRLDTQIQQVLVTRKLEV